jgi:hypothetical protein
MVPTSDTITKQARHVTSCQCTAAAAGDLGLSKRLQTVQLLLHGASYSLQLQQLLLVLL